MKKHEFINLKLGIIEQYSMIIKKKELSHWKNFGWLTYNEIGLPNGDEHAYMLYGEMKKSETLIFNKPKRLIDVTTNKIIGLEVKEITTHLGTYGMGGPGFFGILLENNEYLTYAVWSAGDYVLIDNKVVTCNSELYSKTTPWTSNFGGKLSWDNLTEYIKNSKITNIKITDDSCKITLLKKSKTIEILYVKNDKRLPRIVGRKRNAYKKGLIADYLIFQHENATLIV